MENVSFNLILIICGTMAALLAAAFTPVSIKVARMVGAVDKPDARRIHSKPIPRLGGLGLMMAFAGALAFAAYFFPQVFEQNRSILWAILAGAGLIFATGVYDDIKGIRPVLKLAAQVAVAVIAYYGGLRLEVISWPFAEGGQLNLGWIALPISIFWFVGLMNAVNIIDGLDGLCSGICGISCFIFAIIISRYDQSIYALLPAVAAGLCAGFLVHNYHPARTFLGDSGSLFLGYIIACATLTTGTKSTAVFTLVIPMLCLAVPVMDTGFAIVRRLLRGQHPFAADREHIHHRLLALGLSQPRVVAILWFITAYLGLTAFTLEKADAPLLTVANALFLLVGAMIWIHNIAFLNVLGQKDREEVTRLSGLHKQTSDDTPAFPPVAAEPAK